MGLFNFLGNLFKKNKKEAVKKSEPKKQNWRSVEHVGSKGRGTYRYGTIDHQSNSVTDDILNPLNPLSPLSVYSDDDTNKSHHDSTPNIQDDTPSWGGNDTTSYDNHNSSYNSDSSSYSSDSSSYSSDSSSYSSDSSGSFGDF